MHTIVTITVSTFGGLILIWLLLLAYLAVFRPDGHTIRETSRILPDAIRLVRRLTHEQTLSRPLRIRLFLLLAYLAMPIDIVPDFIPVLGLADDAIILCLVLRGVIRNANHEVIRRNWPGTDAGLAVLARLCRITMTPSSTL